MWQVFLFRPRGDGGAEVWYEERAADIKSDKLVSNPTSATNCASWVQPVWALVPPPVTSLTRQQKQLTRMFLRLSFRICKTLESHLRLAARILTRSWFSSCLTGWSTSVFTGSSSSPQPLKIGFKPWTSAFHFYLLLRWSYPVAWFLISSVAWGRAHSYLHPRTLSWTPDSYVHLPFIISAWVINRHLQLYTSTLLSCGLFLFSKWQFHPSGWLDPKSCSHPWLIFFTPPIHSTSKSWNGVLTSKDSPKHTVFHHLSCYHPDTNQHHILPGFLL